MNKVAEFGGAEKSLLILGQDIQRYHYRPVVVLGSEGPLQKRLEQLNIKVYVYPLDFPHLKNPVPFLKSIYFLIRIIKKEEIKLIHSNTLWDNQYGVIAAKMTRIPHILHVRGFSEEKSSWKDLYHMGSMAICNSEHTRDIFLKNSKFRKRAEVIYNSVDVEEFKSDNKKRFEIREYYGFRDADFVMGMAGRLTEEKGQLALLKVLLPILEKEPKYKILIAGDEKVHPESKYTEQIISFIKKNDLGRNVILTGFLEDMNGFYNAVDLFLLPSFREPFGRVLIEAMATETPVIASRVGGVPEVVDHEINGYLIQPGDVDSWRKGINDLANDNLLRCQLGESGRKKVIEKFTLHHTTSKIVSIYNELIKC